MANAKINVMNLKKSFGSNEVLKGIDLEVAEGEVVCIIGPSGSGKSTLLRCLNKLEEVTDGHVLIDGKDITEKTTDINKVREEIKAAKEGIHSKKASVCAAPALAVSESDWAGEAILERYLRGQGDWTIRDEPAWTAYMSGSSILRNQVRLKLQEEVLKNTKDIVPGKNVVMNLNFAAEIENGEGMVGYQYLHGTNANAGGFTVNGSLHVEHVAKDGVAKLAGNLRLTWNDIIDPNPQYNTDTWKSRYADICTLGQAKPYTIHIIWTEKRKYTFKPNFRALVID